MYESKTGPDNFPYNIVLIGFMGAGKTSVSKYLGALLDRPVVEMDQVIEEQESCTISEIFAEKGEPYFRDLETALLQKLSAEKDFIISCGGGAALRERNVQAMKKNGRVIWLVASPEVIAERVKDGQNRPLLSGDCSVEHIESLLEQRRGAYEQAADLQIDTDQKTVPLICEELLQDLKKMDER